MTGESNGSLVYQRFTLTVNGQAHSVEAPPDAHLLDVLRERCGVKSPKDGCSPQGQCGACTVLIDGKGFTACARPIARAAGKAVTTLEGIEPWQRDALADAFVLAGGLQCGFCIPGIALRAKELLDKNPDPSDAEIKAALKGNLCRCTGFTKIVDAVKLAGRTWRGEPLPEPDYSGQVGSRLPRYEGRELVLGDKPYVNDMELPGLLHGALRFSDHPRARVLRLDTSQAEALPGVEAVVTAKDVPGNRYTGLIYYDWPAFVAEGEETHFVGDVLAAVAAVDHWTARKAAELIAVEYEVLEPVTDPLRALEPDAPQIGPHGNAFSTSLIKRGDADAALATARYVVTDTYQTQHIEHAFLEPESCLALPDPENPDGLLLYSQGQGIYEDRKQLATFFGWEEPRIRVVMVSNGGAFGGKEDLSVQAQTALLAWRTQRPVKITLSRVESINFHPKRHPIRMEYTMGADEDGTIVAVRARMVGDSGAYASVGGKVLERAAGHATGPYSVPNVDVEAVAVYTNNVPCGAMRGFGANQAAFACESTLDRIADLAGLDKWEIRYRNALEVGDTFCTGQVLEKSVGLKKTLLAVKDAYQAEKYAGIACGIKNVGIGNGVPDVGHAALAVEAGGRVVIRTGFTEMGQGFNTVMIQIACTEAGIDPRLIRVDLDTRWEQFCGMTTASRATVLAGNAVRNAARQLKIDLDGHELTELVGNEYLGEYVCDWTNAIEEPVAKPITHLSFGFATQVVILDDAGKLKKVIAAHDVGKALNPTLLEGQIEGSIHMGLGYALTEKLEMQGGRPTSTTMRSLGLLTARDMPEVEVICVEEEEPDGPFGAKGVGEIGLVPTAPAVAAALRAYDGQWRTELPMRDSPAARALQASKV